MGRTTTFNEAMDAFLRDNWEKYSVRDIAKMMGKAEETLRERGRQLDLKPRGEIRGLIRRAPTRKERVGAKRAALKPESVKAGEEWPDGWSIAPPTMGQLMGRR